MPVFSRKESPSVFPVLAILLGTGFTAMLIGGAVAHAAPSSKLVRGVRITSDVVALARKWAKLRGLPVDWILATIAIESRGDANAIGDRNAAYPEGRSIGLMQVNTAAHAKALAQAGVTREMLFNPDKNLEWGTMILKDAYESVKKALSQKASSVPVSVLVRLKYKGVNTPASIAAGRDPSVAYVAEVANWHEALAQTQALV